MEIRQLRAFRTVAVLLSFNKASDLELETLGFESIRIVAGPNHPLADKATVRTRDLEGETILLSRTDCSYRKSFQQILEKKKVRPRAILEFNSVAAIRQCVIEEVGVTVLPEISIARDISRGRLVALPWEEDCLKVALLMIWYKDRWLSPALRAFMETAREVLKGTLVGGFFKFQKKVKVKSFFHRARCGI